MIAAALVSALMVAAGAAGVSEPVNALTVKIDDSNVERFAEIFRETNGSPSAERLQKDYIDVGGRAIEIFTPGRIEDGENLANEIAQNNQDYRNALEKCSPWVKEAQPLLTAVYLGYQGLVPDQQLPKVSVIIGDGSGGTAANDMQVIDLVSSCKVYPEHDQFIDQMHNVFSHETAHTLQRIQAPETPGEMLLLYIVMEGTAEYLGNLLSGFDNAKDTEDWARPREAWIWDQFEQDLALYPDNTQQGVGENETGKAIRKRWVHNYGSAPEGWPHALGYWLGKQIAASYVENAPEPYTAIRELLFFRDAREILRKSGYAERAKVDQIQGAGL